VLSLKILGPLEIIGGELPSAPTAPRVLNTLALLLVRTGHIVPLETIIEELWGEDPPRSATRTAQTYIYHIRRWMAEETWPTENQDTLLTRQPGYMLRVDPARLDVCVFTRLLDEGRALLRDNQPEGAAEQLRKALDLWSGPPLANVRLGPVLSAYATALMEQHNQALNLRLEADLQLGRHRELIGELRALVATNPFDEWYHGLLICALAGSGRRYDALAAYQTARDIIAEELGLSPSPELRAIQASILRGDMPPEPLTPAARRPIAAQSPAIHRPSGNE
jgi:SARP family transcriptional regulator, regulator of embCAB operon